MSRWSRSARGPRPAPLAPAPVVALAPVLALALALALAGGCSWATSSTSPGTRFGYDRRARIAFMTQGAHTLVDAWRTALREAPTVELIDETALIDLAPAALFERMCRHAIALAAQGRPVDDVVAIIANEFTDDETRCARWRHSRPFFDRLFSKNDNDHMICAQREYAATLATASAQVHVMDAATCRPTRKKILDARLRDPSAPAAQGAATRAHVDAAAALGRGLFPSGLAILAVQGRRIEVSRRGTPLEVGQIFVVRGHAPGAKGTLGRMRVAAVTGERATLEAEGDDLGVGVGDELRRHSIGHQWAAYAMVYGGVVRDDLGTQATIGAGTAVRWSPHKLPVLAELELATEVSEDPGVRRTSFGGATGLRLPLGAIAPYTLVEGGVLGAYQDDVLGRAAVAVGGYYGAGGGVEIWLDRAFLFVDARYRKLATGAWKEDLEEGGGQPVSVPNPDRRTDAILVRLTGGWRF